MTGAERLILIGCLLQGVLCQEFKVFLPQRLEALRGSCVIIPCRFQLRNGFETYLDSSCKGIWMQGRNNVFDSSLTGTDVRLNTIQGNLTGDLLQKDCTTILNNFPSYRRDHYNFRLECDGRLKYGFVENVLIDIKDSLKPKLTPDKVEVMEGTSVSLTCSAAAPCPSLPPTLTWTPTLSDSEENLQENQGQVVTSVLNFIASHIHHGQKISCTARYKKQNGDSDRSSKTSLTVNILYPPKNTSVSVSPSGPVVEGSYVTLTCTSNGNPAVKDYTWYRVDRGQVLPFRYLSSVTTQVSEDKSQFYCEAKNEHGTQISAVIQLDVQYSPRNTAVSVSPSGPVVEGSSVTLACSSIANPAVKNYTWYKVNKENTVTPVQSGQNFTLDIAEQSDSGKYYCETLNDVGVAKSTVVQLDIQYPPKNTSVSVSPSGPVVEGSSVTLTCSSIANPAVENYTWYRVNGRKRVVVGFEQDFTFNATKLSNEQYHCEAENDHGETISESISIDVKFAPEILSSSNCIRTAAQIRCSCESHGNPPPTLEWQLAGQSVSHSADTIIREEPLGSTGLKSSITIHQSQQEDTPILVCLSTNSVGSFSLNMSSTEIQQVTGFHTLSLLIGVAVGAVGMMLVCLLLKVILRKKRTTPSPNQRLEDTAELILTDGIPSQEDSVYANKAMLEGPQWAGGTEDDGGDADTLHYANVDFAKLPAKMGGKQGEGEIRGMASKTSEYAMIRMRPSGSIGEEAGEEGVETDTDVGQGDHTNGPESETEDEVTSAVNSDGRIEDSGLPEPQDVPTSHLSVQSTMESQQEQSEWDGAPQIAADEMTQPFEEQPSNVEEEATYGTIWCGQGSSGERA